MKKHSWHMENPLSCPIVRTMSIFHGKWKPMILHSLTTKSYFYGELKRRLPKVSQKVLTQQLRQLEQDGIVGRKMYEGKVIKVEYFLTAKGKKLMPVLEKMHQFSSEV